MDVQPTDPLTRRALLRGVAAGGGIAAVTLAGCGSEDAESGDDAAASGPLGATSDVAVGSATIFSDRGVVVSQPAEGRFKAFSTTCTHSGCPVDRIEGEEIVCPCHGSRYSIADGSVVNGPATEPLAEQPVSVEGQDLVLG